MSGVDASVIIVGYNTRELLLACLRSLYEQTRDVTFETIVVDNASADGTAQAVAAEFPQVRLIASATNRGFAGANNLAAGEARGRYLLLLNPDTVVLDGAIQKLVRFADRNPQAAIFGGRTLFADGTLNPTSCWGRPTLRGAVFEAIGLASLFRGKRFFEPESLGSWKRDSVRDVDIVTGCLLLIRREVWQQLGGFDPAFFMYGEDADLCLRARAAGHRCVLCPEATIIHYGGRSEAARAGKMIRLFSAQSQLFRKHWSRPRAWLGVRMIDLWALGRLLAYRILYALRLRDRAQLDIWRQVWTNRMKWREANTASYRSPRSLTVAARCGARSRGHA